MVLPCETKASETKASETEASETRVKTNRRLLCSTLSSDLRTFALIVSAHPRGKGGHFLIGGHWASAVHGLPVVYFCY